MKPIILKNTAEDGQLLEATFLPDKGMNLISYKKGTVEIIDQSTLNQFEERFAGLGPLIGPHFHRRRAACVPEVKDESLFPHIARIKSKGISDPFSHGIARYAPWQAVADSTKVEAALSGKDQWNGVALSDLEGQDFKMTFSAELTPVGLQLLLTVVSSTDSLVGLHYYYRLPDGKGRVISQSQNEFLENGMKKTLPSEWLGEQQRMVFDLAQSADYTFFPYPHPREGMILLETADYTLKTSYVTPSQENCWQLYHPEGASFACVEPISAQDPHHPNLSVSSLKVTLTIL